MAAQLQQAEQAALLKLHLNLDSCKVRLDDETILIWPSVHRGELQAPLMSRNPPALLPILTRPCSFLACAMQAQLLTTWNRIGDAIARGLEFNLNPSTSRGLEVWDLPFNLERAARLGAGSFGTVALGEEWRTLCFP
jgi:hypothetical protein